ncbi:MAG: hybrid sensor histidine kinase/response regulator [Bdellovibrionaceae bacterium]|nr:hybrid sensor histidine kinase/response regulator [Pseudobdellovibrionaceae bacterium]
MVTAGLNPKPTILCVDDENDNLEALERIFRKKYNVLKASSGKHALELIQQSGPEISLILTDQRMPEMTGIEVLEKVIGQYPEMIRILITGFTDLESVIQAINKGQIYQYITKPWDPVELSNTVDRAVDRYTVGKELAVRTKQLEIAYNELKTLDDAKSKFMILINHELKTPLTSIINFLSLLNESPLTDDQKLYVDRTIKSSNKLKQIIDDVLILVRAELNQLHLDPQAIILNSVEHMVNAENQSFKNKKHLVLVETIDPLEFKADKRLFEQILNRILNNAIKFATENSVIEIKGSKIGNFYEFKIINNGDNIAEAAMKKIFQPFFIDENIMNHSIGLGLGLSICDKLLKLHGTSLNIRNIDHGVQVAFYFPLMQ